MKCFSSESYPHSLLIVLKLINEKKEVINEYESAKAIPNPQIMSKLQRALGVKLSGPHKGQPLGGPKK